MTDLSGYNVWGTFLILGLLLSVLLIANILKKAIPFLRNSLMPTSVLGGLMILAFTAIYNAITGENFFELAIFGSRLETVDGVLVEHRTGIDTMETLTYHCLALGFIASSLKSSANKISKKRTVEIFNTGVTTVSTYLLQAVFGMGITLLAAALFMPGFFGVSGILLPFGFGQGTGQALNYGTIYEVEHGFVGGKTFGLTIAALGFLSASVGGVIHLNVMKKKGKLGKFTRTDSILHSEEIESPDEIPMQESIDKMTLQISLIAVAYMMTFGLMALLSKLLPGMKSTIYGFNFIIGVLSASLIKVIMKLLMKLHIIKEKYTNNFLLTRASNLFFDIMVIAGIAAIRLNELKDYWGIMLILGVVGLVVTYLYNYLVAKLLFKEYSEEQFLMMYGMLTGTASTGIILLREADPDFRTPASDNLVLQNFPAIVFGFPMMLLANMAPTRPILTFIILVVFFLAMNILLFRSFIFKKKAVKDSEPSEESDGE